MELLDTFEALARWFHAAGLLNRQEAGLLRHGWEGTERAKKATEAIREFRERLRSEITAWESGRRIRQSTIEELNELLAAHPVRMRLKAKGGSASVEAWFEATEPEDLYAPLAQSAARLFAFADRRRVRKCGNCVLHFQDVSKKGTRRWCSMKMCGNRLKVAAYAARERERE